MSAETGAPNVGMEVLPPALMYSAKAMSSMIKTRREVAFYSAPGIFKPPVGRLIRVSMADGASWLQTQSQRPEEVRQAMRSKTRRTQEEQLLRQVRRSSTSKLLSRSWQI